MSINSKLFSGFDSEPLYNFSTEDDIPGALDTARKQLLLNHVIATLQSKVSNTPNPSKPQNSPENNCLNQDLALNLPDNDLFPGSPLENLHVKPISSSKPKRTQNMDFFCMENFKNENHSTEESSDSIEGRTSETPLPPNPLITFISSGSAIKGEKSYNIDEFLSQTENHSTEGSTQSNMTPLRSEQAFDTVSVNMSPSCEPSSEGFIESVFDEMNAGIKENSIPFTEDTIPEDLPYTPAHYQNQSNIEHYYNPIEDNTIYQEDVITFDGTDPSFDCLLEDGVMIPELSSYPLQEPWDIMARFSPNTAFFPQGSLNNNYVNVEENSEADSLLAKVPVSKKAGKRKTKKEEKVKEVSYEDKSKAFNPKNKIALILIFFRNGFLTHEKMDSVQIKFFESFLGACDRLGVSSEFLQSQGFMNYLSKFYENAFKGAKKGTRDYTAKRIALDLAQDKVYGLQICTLLKYFVSEVNEAFIDAFDSFLESSRMQSHNKEQIREFKFKLARQIEEIEDALKSPRPIEELKECTNISVFLKGDSKKNAGKGKNKRSMEDLGDVDSEIEFIVDQKKKKLVF